MWNETEYFIYLHIITNDLMLWYLNLILECTFRIQEERSERHKYKNVLRERGVVGIEPALDVLPDVGSYDTGDPNTTNLYLGNLNPKVYYHVFIVDFC